MFDFEWNTPAKVEARGKVRLLIHRLGRPKLISYCVAAFGSISALSAGTGLLLGKPTPLKEFLIEAAALGLYGALAGAWIWRQNEREYRADLE